MPISYDAIGNPLNDGTWTYTWQNGRQLAGMSKDGTTVSFKYNAAGLRSRKIVNGVVTKYTLHGKNVVHMTKGNDNLHFFYDAQNRPAVVVFNGTAYAYVKNLQGDIIAILDSAGTAVVRYTYDAWGAPTSATGTMAATLGVLNPFRYRGYVYDEETGLYYLRTRYFNPENARFLNADVYISTGRELLDSNMFAYCWNMPVVFSDAAGTNPLETILDDGDTRPGDEIKVNHGRCPGSGGCPANVASTSTSTISIPQKACSTFSYLNDHKFTPPNGYKGGSIYENDGRDGSAVLPSQYSPFQEFDIDPKVKGQPRNGERIVIGFGSGGSAWYTPDHYRHFFVMQEGFIK